MSSRMFVGAEQLEVDVRVRLDSTDSINALLDVPEIRFDAPAVIDVEPDDGRMEWHLFVTATGTPAFSIRCLMSRFNIMSLRCASSSTSQITVTESDRS